MMKSKVVRGIINGGVLAAVAALGITVYQLGTKPLTESKDDSVQMEETGLEAEISDGGDAQDAEVSGNGGADAADGSGIADEVKNAAVGADDMAGSSGTGDDDGATGDATDGDSSAAGTGAAAANANGSNSADAGVNGSAVNAGEAAGKLADGTGVDSAASVSAGNGVSSAGTAAGNNLTEGTGTDSTETSAAGIAAQNLNFTENSLMEWPVRGTVLIDYNMNETVYYPTLDQYRVSPAIAVQAVEDAPVYAAADGQVLSIERDACTGTTVTMELGNGYQAVYGQLKDLTVAEGDTVKEGEVIGNISEPTKYYSVEGPNLYFAVKKDGNPVDPFEYLE